MNLHSISFICEDSKLQRVWVYDWCDPKKSTSLESRHFIKHVTNHFAIYGLLSGTVIEVLTVTDIVGHNVVGHVPFASLYMVTFHWKLRNKIRIQ